MREAFQAVKRNRGAAGIDKVSINMFAANLVENLAALMRDLKTGTFRPYPLQLCQCNGQPPAADNEVRELHVRSSIGLDGKPSSVERANVGCRGPTVGADMAVRGDLQGNVIQQTLPNGMQQTSRFDLAWNQPTRVTTELNQNILFDLTPNGDVESITWTDPRVSGTPGNLWQNQLNRYDVNSDGVVAPIDVLVTINRLNNEGAGGLWEHRRVEHILSMTARAMVR